MAECNANYPAEMPLGCVQQLLTIARAGTIVERSQEFAAAAWQVTGYCLKTFVGEPLVVINGLPPARSLLPPPVRAELEELNLLLNASAVEPVGSQLSVFLRTVVLPALKAALQQLLDSLGE